MLLICGEALADDSYRVRAVETAAALIQQHDAALDWPSGILGGGANPSLMVGTAGIGHHFLRHHAPHNVPPVLYIAG